MHFGSGPGLTPKRQGARAGAETVILTEVQMATHTHAWKATGATATVATPGTNALATSTSPAFGAANTLVALNAGSVLVNNNGGGAHDNVQPFLCVNFIIALTGVYPSRS